MPATILCCGEALIDMLPAMTDDNRESFVPVCGGSVFNTAVALGRLGENARFLGGLSTDMFGETLRKSLEESHVDARLSLSSDRPTTLAFVRLVNGQAQYAFFDENSAGRMLRPEDIPDLPQQVKTLFFGGISLATEPCATAYETLMQRQAGRCVTMLDPNIRPGFIADEIRYRARLEHMVSMADIVKVSDEDLHWWFGAGDVQSLARKILAMGPNLVFLTRGSSGATAITPLHTVACPASEVSVVDTVGAGDTFNAGVLHALNTQGALTKPSIQALDRSVLQEALGLAVQAASITVSRAGADAPWKEELQ